MTIANPDQDYAAIERFSEWREEVVVGGLDLSAEAYHAHLYHEQDAATLAEISRMATDLGKQIDAGQADDRDLDAFRRGVLALIPDRHKEVTT